MKKYFILFIICILVISVLFFIFWIRPISQPVLKENNTITLPIHTVKKQAFTYTKSFIGSVEAIQSVSVVPYLSAYLKEIYVQSGTEVSQGETLFLLDQKIPLADLNQAKEAVKQAFAKRENAQNYYERMKNTNKKAISPTELEQAKTEYEAAEASYQKTLSAENQAQTIYNYTIIQAPISGWVGDITATIGEYLSPENKTLATIVRFSPIRLIFSIPMSVYKSDYLSHDKATLQVILTSGQVLEFTNFKIAHNNQADKATDSLSFFVDVPNDNKLLIPGAYIQIRFVYSEQGILADKNWITLTPTGAEVTLLKNGVIIKQQVEIGAPIGTQYWIKSGLNKGDTIITVPVSPYQIGQPAEGIPQ